MIANWIYTLKPKGTNLAIRLILVIEMIQGFRLIDASKVSHYSWMKLVRPVAPPYQGRGSGEATIVRGKDR